jgi:DNA-binding response OmpR family regulator
MEPGFEYNNQTQQNIVGVDLDLVQEGEYYTVLILEDEPDTLSLLKSLFLKSGFHVSGAATGMEALKKVKEINPDLLIIDLMLPEMDGWETYEHLRVFSNVPVMVVSAISDKERIVAALKMGVDDYVTKPFTNAEVVERARAILRRTTNRPCSTENRIYLAGVDLLIDVPSREVVFQKQHTNFTDKEFSLLVILAQSAPKLVPYQEISNTIWGEDNELIRKRIKYLVFSIRKKLAEINAEIEVIQTAGRLGYKITSD